MTERAWLEIPEFRQGFLEYWFQRRGIKAAFFDYDDTIVDTYSEFRSRMLAFCEYVASVSPHAGLVPQALLEEMLSYDRDFGNQIHHVLPYRLMTSGQTVARVHGAGDDERLEGNLVELLTAYETVPKPFGGARDIVEDCAAVLPVHVLTHASEAWTTKKKQGLGWGGVFSGFYCVPPESAKDIEAWRAGIELFGYEPHEVMAVGNSLPHDIQPALALGVAAVGWVAHGSSREAPEGVIRIEEIGELVEGLA